MNKSTYFLIPAVIIAIALIGYSTIKHSNLSLATDTHTTEKHSAHIPANTVANEDSGKAAHVD